MVTRKYIKDYKFSETVTEKGRIKTEAVYVGELYGFADEAAAKKAARLFPVLCCVMWALFVAALLPRTGAMRLMYVALPFAFAALPLGYLTGAAFSLLRRRPPLLRSQSDRFASTLPGSALATAILAGVSLAGECVGFFAAREDMTPFDALFAVCDALILAAALVVFVKRAGVATKKLKGSP